MDMSKPGTPKDINPETLGGLVNLTEHVRQQELTRAYIQDRQAEQGLGDRVVPMEQEQDGPER